MVGNSAASRLAHLYPELAFLGGAELDQGLVISALGATRWEAGQLQPDRRRGHRRGSWRYENQVRGPGLALASPPDLHGVSTRPAMPLHVRGSCWVASPARRRHELHRRHRDRNSVVHIEIPQERIDDLRRRIAVTRWPGMELVSDRSQGVQLAMLQELARYWTSEYDWRTCEARLNALPQFTTEIDGVEIRRVRCSSQDCRMG